MLLQLLVSLDTAHQLPYSIQADATLVIITKLVSQCAVEAHPMLMNSAVVCDSETVVSTKVVLTAPALFLVTSPL